MEKHHISFKSKFLNENMDIFNNLANMNIKKMNSMSQHENFQNKKIMTNELEIKVNKCFTKLYQILRLKKLTLYKTFLAYDSDRSGQLAIG